MGGTIGALAGAFGGRVDTVLMRIVDVLLAIPGILLAIGVVVWLDRGLPQIMFAVALTNLPVFARILRGSLLSLQGADYVVAARSVGASTPRILFRHMLPNAVTPLIVAATLALATAIIDVAGLGFLGLGPADPRIAEWGTMLTGATSFYRQAPVDHLLHRASRSRSRRSGSTCSATGCASRSIRGSGDEDDPRRRRDRRPAARSPTSRCSRSRTCSCGSGRMTGRSSPSTGSASRSSEGERLGLVGESGCGKSVTNLAIMRLLPKPAGKIEGGRVMFDGQDLLAAPRGGDARHPRPRHRDDLPGPDDVAEPGPDHRGADGRDDPGPQEDVEAGRPGSGDRDPRDGRDPATRRPGSRTFPHSSRAGCASGS